MSQRLKTLPRPKLRLVHREQAWWIDAAAITPDVPLWGPYSKSEAIDARDSYHENAIDLFPPHRIVTGRRAR